MHLRLIMRNLTSFSVKPKMISSLGIEDMLTNLFIVKMVHEGLILVGGEVGSIFLKQRYLFLITRVLSRRGSTEAFGWKDGLTLGNLEGSSGSGNCHWTPS